MDRDTSKQHLAKDRQCLERRTASWKNMTLGSTKKGTMAAILNTMQTISSNTVA